MEGFHEYKEGDSVVFCFVGSWSWIQYMSSDFWIGSFGFYVVAVFANASPACAPVVAFITHVSTVRDCTRSYR